jgi:hypothetical protein
VKQIYYPEHIRFLGKHIRGRSYKELALLFDERFGLQVTENAIKKICGRNGLCNGFGHGNPNYPPPRKFTDLHVRFLKKIVKGRKYAELAELFNMELGLSVTGKQISNLCKRRGLANGIDTRFQKGHIPFNKGRKGYCSPGCEKGWFPPGHMPFNTMPIGSERVTAEGYVEVKISNKSGPSRNRWKGKHVLIWEEANGPLPRGNVVLFSNGNRRNFKPENLISVSRRELAVINHMGLLSANKDTTKTGVNVAKLKILIADRKRGTFKSKKKKLVVIDNNGNRVFIAYDEKLKRYFAARDTKHGVRRLRASLKSRKTLEEAQEDLTEYAQKRGWQKV